jgi:urea transport system ATP-binding protein
MSAVEKENAVEVDEAAASASTMVGGHIEGPKGDFVLTVEGLGVSFDGFKAVDNLNLYIDKNEIRVVIGPNGAGKTTVLDLICGRTKATSGSIRFKGKELTRMSEHLEVSYPKGRTVLGALAFKRSAEVIERIHAVASEIMLGDLLDTEAGLLSHGQKQWLEIGMLLIQDPELLMLDEPVAGMSARERELTGDLLRRICANRSVIVIEHDMEFVKSIAHRVTVLHQGKILKEGSMDAVQKDPKVIEVYLGH